MDVQSPSTITSASGCRRKREEVDNSVISEEESTHKNLVLFLSIMYSFWKRSPVQSEEADNDRKQKKAKMHDDTDLIGVTSSPFARRSIHVLYLLFRLLARSIRDLAAPVEYAFEIVWNPLFWF